MKNQVNVGNVDSQNNRQIEQNLTNQPVLIPGKPKINYLLIAKVILFCFVVFGFGGYYLGKQTSQSQQITNGSQIQATPTVFSTPSDTNKLTVVPRPTLEPILSWKTYASNKLGLTFKYPTAYEASEIANGLFVIRTPGDRLMQGGGIRIDAEPQWINQTTLEEAKNWINSTLVVSKTYKLDNWSIFVGVGRDSEVMIKDIVFKEAVTNYKNGVIKLEIMTPGPYDDIFEEVVKSFTFTN